MKKYPFVKQAGITDCGPACLLMITKYYKGNDSIEKIKLLAKTDKKGTNALNLIEAAKKLGFSCHAYKTNIDTLINSKDIKLPCIAHTIIKNKYLHYVVIYKIDYKNKTITIADPSNKIKTLSYEKFNHIYNNIIIILYPTKKIEYKKYHSINKLILSILKNNVKYLLKIWLMSFITIVLTIYILSYTKLSLDNLGNYQELAIVYATLVFIIIIKHILEKIMIKTKICLSNNIEYHLITSVYEKTFSLPYQYYCNHSTGEIIKQINDLENTKETIMLITLTILFFLPLSLIAFILLFNINKELLYISLIGVVINIIILNWNKRKHNQKMNNIKLNSEEINGFLYNTISKINSIIGLNVEKSINKMFKEKYHNYLKKSSQTIYPLKNKENFTNSINLLIDGTIIYIGCHLIMTNKISLSSLILFLSIKDISITPINHIFQNNINIKEGIISIKRIKELDYITVNNAQSTKKFKGELLIKKINHIYDYDKKINIKANLKIKPGEKIMLIGKTGCGKTTLFNILFKNIKTGNNNIFIDKHDINDLSVKDIKNNIVHIPQEELILLDNIDNNITMSEPTTELENIKKICCIENNEVYNDNLNLSGGEKQKIVLARALLKDSKILLIDEGLSKLDTNSERIILKNIFKNYQDKTIIIISHRTDNIDLFDKIVEIKNNNLIIKEKRW